MSAAPPKLLDPRRILVRSVNWLGDAVMTTPALLRLRERFSAAEITILCHRKLAALWEHHPAVNSVLRFESDESAWSISRRLASSGFDLGLALPNSPRSALELFLAGVPERVGYARAWRNWFLTRKIECHSPKATRKRSISEIRRLTAATATSSGASLPNQKNKPLHQIYDYLQLVAALGASPEPVPPLLNVTESEISLATAKFLSPVPGPGVIVLGLNPGAEYGPAKRWSASNFAAAARRICDTHPNVRWLLFGGPGDVQTCAEIAETLGATAMNLAGKTSLRELMACFSLCRALLTNDTGPMHLAAALGTPVVALFGSTSPELTGPGLPDDGMHKVLRIGVPCAPCFRRVCPIDNRCLMELKPELAVAALTEVLARCRG